MLEWFVNVNRKCRELAVKANDALAHLNADARDSASAINGYMKADYDALNNLWAQVDPQHLSAGRLSDLSRHIHFGKKDDYADILRIDLPDIVERAESLAFKGVAQSPRLGFEDLLHPEIINSSLDQYKNGMLRDAVLNGVIAVFDMIRARTKLDLDGLKLTGQAFGVESGHLIFSDLDSESGRNDQVGFMKVYEGVYAGVRNVKAHSLSHDLDDHKAGQYLVMLSLLARRIDECKQRKQAGA